ncbi:LysE family translocator [Pseudomonas rhizoryzae]|uniref:LysE family translocator n=1 Tax=Pseudomonas rhizoryzae TaxID=2571129 RepID=UPI0007379DB7|nr:LysE family transporter [Pseudomonas rhizoryzae]KTT29643.1 threonine transporter [Pseudomonas psychrotolerans]KTT31558.1 threonine transporter [Pseudomonas psychrotolerans]KTT72940.1 threonine transporter [Pseudomonas psychrotolerans]
MSSSLILAAVLGTLLIGAMSPGPSFILISRIALESSRRSALAAALAMGLGAALFAALALLGLTALLVSVEWLYGLLRIAGGLYLLYLGWRIWRGASRPLAIAGTAANTSMSSGRALWLGLLTQLSNPKTAVVYVSVFASLVPPSTPNWVLLVLPPLVMALEAGWYAVIALAFSAQRPQALYLRAKGGIDRFTGAVLGLVGARLLAESSR